ncbi:LOW QUALITY PROTEIN: IQ domain-containing protein N, partial [Galemys pyrenaicus]
AKLTLLGTKTMQQATQRPLSPNEQNSYQPQHTPDLQDKAETHSQHKPSVDKETTEQQPAMDKTMSHHIPRLRAVVESQAFKNILVDEMDMMLSRAATLIQASWRGYQLRQKLTSQMMAARSIQEAWRRFNTRRLLRSGRAVGKKVSMEEGDIPYHPPQQVRFQPLEEGKSPLAQPVMVSKETQFPSTDTLATCTPQMTPQPQGTPQLGMQDPCAVGGSGVTFLPHQTFAIRLPGPEAKSLLTRTGRSACLSHHVEGDMVKTKQITTKAKAGTSGPPSSGKYVQAVHGTLKTHMGAEVKTLPHKAPAPVITKTPAQSSPVPTVTITKTAFHTDQDPDPAVPSDHDNNNQDLSPAMPSRSGGQGPTPGMSATHSDQDPIPIMPSRHDDQDPPPAVPTSHNDQAPAPDVPTSPDDQAPAPDVPASPDDQAPAPDMCPPAPMTKPPLQSCLAAMMARIPTLPCPVPEMTVTKTPPHTCPPPAVAKVPLQSCPVTPVTKTPAQMQPTAVMTNTSTGARPEAVVTKFPPQICLLASVLKPPPQTRPTATMTKTPPQTCPVAGTAKTPAHARLAPTPAKATVQPGRAATESKTPPQMPPGPLFTRTPPQTRLAAMITRTPAQLRSVAAILRTLCTPPPAGGSLKTPPTAADGIPNASSQTCLSGPKAKSVTARQVAGMTKISSHSCLTEGKVKYFPAPQPGAGTTKTPARSPVEAEKDKALPQKQVKTVSNTCVAMHTARVSPWGKVAEGRKSSSQALLRTDVVKVQSQGFVPVDTAVTLPQEPMTACSAKTPPQAQLATYPSATFSQRHPLAELTKVLSQGHPPAKLATALAQSPLGACLSKVQSQGHMPPMLAKVPSLAHLGTRLTKAQSQAHLVTGMMKVQSQAHLPTGLTKAQSQAQLVTEAAKCLYSAHQAAELSSKTQSQPLLAGSKASTQSCQPQTKLDDKLTQLPVHSFMQVKATQSPCQGPSETQSMLVPLLASAGHSTCNVESWGDSGAARAHSSTVSSATPCQEELAASQLASLCAELAAVLGSQEDLRTLLTKALSQGEVRTALNQALSKEVLTTTMTKALPQGMLGMALVKALSWGEMGIALSRALSRGELRAELTKAMQGRLADVLSKALTEEEHAALSQALCQGELGAVLGQSLSQAALRTGVILPKATSKSGSGVTVMPAPVEVSVDHPPTPLTPAVLQGPADAGVAGGQAWNSTVPTVAVGPMSGTVPPAGAWEPVRGNVPWDSAGSEAAADPRQPDQLVASVQAVEKIIIQAVITIQACARGYLVRRTIRVWHQWAVVIQAAWRGYCVRRDLIRLTKAATVIQAAWRGYYFRRSQTQQILLPGVWVDVGSGARTTSDHRCFQSCQPHLCAFCQSLSSGLGSPPSVVMLVGSSPRTCHMCGQTLPTRVVHGTGQGAAGQAWGYGSRRLPRTAQHPHCRNKAAVAIQAAWRGFLVRRQLRQQQLAAKMLQATWRGHHTRSSLSTDALLGSAVWDSPRHTQWPGV